MSFLNMLTKLAPIVLFIPQLVFAQPFQTTTLRGFEIGQPCHIAVERAEAMKREGMHFSGRWADGLSPCESEPDRSGIRGLATSRFEKDALKDTVFVHMNDDLRVEQIHAITVWFNDEKSTFPSWDSVHAKLMQTYGLPTLSGKWDESSAGMFGSGPVKSEVQRFLWLSYSSDQTATPVPQSKSQLQSSYAAASGVKRTATIGVVATPGGGIRSLSLTVIVEVGVESRKPSQAIEIKL
jgi:hypothetical protein